MVESRYHLDRPASLGLRADNGNARLTEKEAPSTDMKSTHATITFVDLAGSEPSAHLLDYPGKALPQHIQEKQRKREVCAD
jgi:hypothetical protein